MAKIGSQRRLNLIRIGSHARMTKTMVGRTVPEKAFAMNSNVDLLKLTADAVSPCHRTGALPSFVNEFILLFAKQLERGGGRLRLRLLHETVPRVLWSH